MGGRVSFAQVRRCDQAVDMRSHARVWRRDPDTDIWSLPSSLVTMMSRAMLQEHCPQPAAMKPQSVLLLADRPQSPSLGKSQSRV